jgi:hypothetical protein
MLIKAVNPLAFIRPAVARNSTEIRAFLFGAFQDFARSSQVSTRIVPVPQIKL